MLDAPELYQGLQLYWNAFCDLTTTRPTDGMGTPMPLSVLNVLEYAKAYGFDEDQTDTLVHMVRKMDSAFLKWSEQRRKKETGGNQ